MSAALATSVDFLYISRLLVIFFILHVLNVLRLISFKCFAFNIKQCNFYHIKCFALWWKSPGPMLMGGDSCLRGHEFESQHRILDEPLLTFVVKLFLYLKRPKTNKKSPGMFDFKNVSHMETTFLQPTTLVSQFNKIFRWLILTEQAKLRLHIPRSYPLLVLMSPLSQLIAA